MFLHRILNPFFYHIRSRLQWRRAGYTIAAPGVTVDFVGEAYTQWERLYEAYPIKKWADNMDRPLFMRNLLVLDWLDQLRPMLPNQISAFSWLDIGSKNFDYAYAFRAFQEGVSAEQKELTGIELDGYRVYRDLHSRYDHAAYHAEQTDARYVVGDVLDTSLSPADMVSMFFPFVFVKPLLLWGLAIRDYQPQAIYARALALSKPGGWLLILNQGEEEAKASRRLLLQCQEQAVDLVLLHAGQLECRMVHYPADVYFFLIQRKKTKTEQNG